MIGDNVHGMCLIVVLLLEKVLVLIGGMPITGIIFATRDGYRIDGNPTVGSVHNQMPVIMVM